MPDLRSGKIAWVFPGQGSQCVGMGRELAETDPEIAALFMLPDDILGFSLREIIFNGPEEVLQQTPVQQPAMLVTCVAYLRALKTRGLLPEADFVAGHSLGEYAALVASGSLSLEDALRLVHRRGELMQEYGAGAMAAIIGLPPDDVAAVARDAGAEVANYNSPEQTTVSGRAEAVERAMALAKERGAKRALLLPISAAFHSSLMAPAAEGMRPMIEATSFQPARVPLIGNVSAEPLRQPDELRQELIEHICASVRWVDSVATLGREGVDTYYEIGPGRVLAGLIGRCDPRARVRGAERLLAEATAAA